MEKCDIVFPVCQKINYGSKDKLINARNLISEIKDEHKAGKIVGLHFAGCSISNFPYFVLVELISGLNPILDDIIFVYMPFGFRSYIAKAKAHTRKKVSYERY